MSMKLLEERRLTEEERKLFEQADRDFKWLAEHSSEIWKKYKGKHIAVINEELFVGDSDDEVRKKIKLKHPGANVFIWKIPFKEKLWIL